MKNATEKYIHVLKRLLPGWSGADVGHSAGRDWYAILILSVVMGLALVAVGMYRFLYATQGVVEEGITLPVRGLPVTQDEILKTQALFEARAFEFAQFSERIPEVPNPGTKSEPETVPEEVSVPEESPAEE